MTRALALATIAVALASPWANAAPKEKIIFQLQETADGAAPYGALISDGSKFYGTTSASGGGSGTVFSIGAPADANPEPKKLWTFGGGSNDGCQPFGRLTFHSVML